ncbi:unnamed protein product [Dovyalis caffra]|uniref:Uncharacterized protein n=1 Tax=Dovyalis caffra TaxID=77055 RepID=A0AAV1QSL5_9ROSI|nr:unnamed protein product [Dovyalis caffra]
MAIKVDLGCEKCRKKIKKVLCKICEGKHSDNNCVTVASSFPEKIKKKICCKGGEAVKGIEIKVPEKPPAKPTDNKAQPKKQEKPTSLEPVTGHPIDAGPGKITAA